MKQFASLLLLLISFNNVKGQILDNPTPFSFDMKDKVIIIPSYVCTKIDTGKVYIYFTINSSAKLIDFQVIGLKLISKSKNINFTNEHFSAGHRKIIPSEIQPLIPFITTKMAELKITKNKFAKPKKRNYGTIRLNLVSEK